MGILGHKAPRNVVYRTGGLLSAPHQIAQWQGASESIYRAPEETAPHAHKATIPTKEDEHELTRTDESAVSLPTASAAEVETFDFGDAGADFDYKSL